MGAEFQNIKPVRLVGAALDGTIQLTRDFGELGDFYLVTHKTIWKIEMQFTCQNVRWGMI